MNGIQRTARLAGAVALAMTLGACGSDGPTDPVIETSPSPTPPPPFVIYGDSGSVPPDSAVYIDFSIPNAGTVAATVDWTFASSDVWLAMTTSACNDFIQAFIGQCSHIGTPNLGNSKPKTVTGTVNQATTGRLWIGNFATVDESMAVQITLARSSATSEAVVLAPLARSWTPVPASATRALRAFEN
jgi:hypothetical protein